MSATISKDEFRLYISNFGGKGIQISPLVFNGTTPYQIRKHYRGNQQTLWLRDTSIVNAVHLLHKEKKMTVGKATGYWHLSPAVTISKKSEFAKAEVKDG